MALANITLDDGTEINDIEVPEWLAPHVTTYLDAVAAVTAAALDMGAAQATHAAAEAELLSKQQALASAQQTLNTITAAIAANLGGS